MFGGTFNPPHNGHVTMARAAVNQLGLDKLLIVPDCVPPHKPLPSGVTARQRYDMAALMAASVGRMAEASDIELHHTGKSYTSDTLRMLHQQYPDAELWLLMGSDMFLSLHTWHEPEVICELAHIAAFRRVEEDICAAMKQQKTQLERQYQARVALLDNPELIELSSTDVRAALAAGQGSDLVPEAVWGYIRREHLYGTTADLKHLTVDELRPIAMSYLKPKRMPHVLGTEQEAVRLAERYGADVTKARIAALLHDCTKKLDMDEQLALCKKYHIPLDELERKALKLLHSKTGAAIARDVFAVDDDVYNAIMYHTTGKPDMTLPEKIIYLADYIEPTRDFPGVEALRRTVYEDLDRGLLMGLTMTIDEMEEMGNPVHHMTRDARDYLMKRGIS
mgnify:CR=1 FL=1